MVYLMMIHIHTKEFDWYSLIRDHIDREETTYTLYNNILIELRKLSREYFHKYDIIYNIICIYDDTFSNEIQYYNKLLWNYNYFDDFSNNNIYKRLYNLIDNDNIFFIILHVHYSVRDKDTMTNIKLSFKNPESIFDIFLKNNPKIFLFYPNEIKNNRELVKRLLKIRDGMHEILQYVSDELKNDREFIKELVLT